MNGSPRTATFDRPKGLRRILLSIFCAAVVVITAFAQYRAGIQGVVTDPNGAVVPAASVKLTSKESAVVREATSSGEGVFTIVGLAPGSYELSVEKAGFSKKVLANVQVAAEQMQSVSVQLDVGQMTESVTVDASMAPLVETETAIVGGTITNKEIERLPSFGRDPYQLLRLTPGVFGDGAQGAGGGSFQLPGTNTGGPSAIDSIFKVENGPQIIANGTRQNSNDIQIDGVGVNSTSWGGAAVITPNEESVKEIRVIANNYSAEYGRTSGAQILVVSQNGTNDYHGSAFFKWHRPGLDAYQKWNGPGTPSPVTRDEYRFNQMGGSLGGAIWKNKLFAFASYETVRDNSKTIATGWYESPNFLQNAGPSGSIARQFLSYPGEGPAATGQTITKTCAQVGLPSTQCRDTANGLDLGSPLKTALGTKDPTFGAPGTPYGIGNGFDGIADAVFVQTVAPLSNTNVQYNGRIDFQATSKDLIAFSSYFVPIETHSYNGPQRAANQWNHSSLAQSWTGIYTRTISPSTINEARCGASGWNWDEFATNPQEPWGLPTANIRGIGGVGIQSYGAPGPSIFNQLTYNFRDTLTKVHNSHSLKFGADVSHAKFLDEAPWSARPNYDFNNLWDFANDAPVHENSNFDPVTGQPSAVQKNLRFNIVGIFAQDDWKIRPNLTINLGLRWEYFSPLTETNGNISNVMLGQGAAVLSGIHIRKGGDLFGTSKNNYGPQLGFAWSPGGALFGGRSKDKLVLRGGFGVGYNLQQLAITSNGRFNPPFEVALDLYNSDILYAVNSNIHTFTGYPVNPQAIQTFDKTTGLPTSGAPVSLTGFPSFMPSTVTYRYSLDAQYDLGHNWVASMGYQGSQSRHYTRQSRLDWVYYPASNPRVANVSWYANDANAHYNALLTEVKHAFANSFELDFQYRRSRNTDQGSQDYAMNFYPWNASSSTGPSDYDVTNNFKLWGVWTPSIFRGKNNPLEKVLGGWTISAILTAHSGFPWTPQYCNPGGNVVYPNSGYYNCLLPAAYSGGAGTSSSNSTFMTTGGNFPKGALAYFTVPTWPATGQYPAPAASVNRNMFRGPGYFGNDVTLVKAFTLPKLKILGEGARLNLQANFYNLVNKLNLTNVNSTISQDGVTSNSQFGSAQGALGGRTIEFQAKFKF